MSGTYGVSVKGFQRSCARKASGKAALASAMMLGSVALAPVAIAQEAPEQIPLPTSSDQVSPDSQGQRSEGEIGQKISFEANEVAYDSEGETIIARGDVILRNEQASVRADEVVWDRKTGAIKASGSVRFVDRAGNQVFTETVELNDAFEAGAMDELLLALRTGGRLAARSADRGEDGIVSLNHAAYSACPVTDEKGCARNPSWRITADRVMFDPAENRIRFEGATLEIFGTRLLPLPGLALRTDGSAESGFLVPDFRIDQVNGIELSGEYYARIADNKDLTLGARVFTEAPPLVSAEWRHFTEKGAYQITGYATNSRRVANFGVAPTTTNEPRGHLFANGSFILSPNWTLTGSVRVASDRTFLRRYDISRDDRLRSTINLERIDDNSYLSIAGWATQTLRIAADQGQIPVAIPAIDYRRNFDEDLLGGQFQLQANTLSLLRTEGQDTQRAFAGARWDKKTLTPLGQLVTFTGLLRGDVYNTNDTLSTVTEAFRGNEGFTARGVATAAVDIEWPLVGEAFGGTQVFTPRVQFVASPPTRNLDIPNEDARAIDLEDSNLFALNRFSGYDRVEDGARVTYGMDWEVNRPGWRVKTNIGQSYRLSNEEEIFPDGTGLSDRFSDFVGRTEVRFRNFVSFTHRFRLDKDNVAVRRNEIDATVGSQRNYVELGYLRLDRDIQTVEDLPDREELRAAARITIGRNWSVFGSGVFNLTNEDEDPVFAPDGFEPIRTRFGIAYRDDCIEFGATWRRDFITFGDAEEGNSFQVFFALRNLGFR
ncbi:LPS assembly protein LptD [uncultured Erythrobacter sp.]|uniref:LPS-assembly protein LptD n=1 Tax=uncultured Erythrobacter sp. TaxID=263913 RepID=UPI0026326700|nr:LPS assembly protein LptD [uncultured Erythrobacter sp.]